MTGATSHGLTEVLAQRIASETSAIIDHNVIITDANGHVLGSGDEMRVGSFHEASLEVVASMRSATHSVEQAEALHGVQPGVTLPIVIGGRVVGTVGITGQPSRVTKFGLLVERQTEMMLQQGDLLRISLERERAIEELVADIGAFDERYENASTLKARAREEGIDLDLPRTAVMLALTSPTSGGALPSQAASLAVIRESFEHRQSIVVPHEVNRFVVLAPADPRDRVSVRQQAEACVRGFRRRTGCDVVVGVGSAASDLSSLRRSYEDAGFALHAAAGRQAGVVAIESVRLEHFLDSTGSRNRIHFVTSVAGPLLRLPDWSQLKRTTTAWCESGFSIVGAARTLSVHRNTLLLRLEKIERLMGWQERSARRYIELYLACVMVSLQDAEGSSPGEDDGISR